MKKLYFVSTVDGDMLVSVDSARNCRYLAETADYKYFNDIETVDNKKEKAIEIMRRIDNDDAWDDDLAYDDIFTDNVEILVEMEVV